MPMIMLQSSDGDIISTDIEIAKRSGTIKTILETRGVEDDENGIVPLPNVNSTTLRKVLTWANYHKDDESQEERTDDMIAWDAEFLNVDQGTLFDLIIAAHYLDIKGLLKSICIMGTKIIKGKTTEELKQMFNITAAEEEQMR